MKTNGLNVNTQAIADGIYAMIVDADMAHIVAFGMIPKQFVDLLEKQLREKVIAITAGQMEMSVEDFRPFVSKEKVEAVIRPIVHEITLGIYRAAKEKGAMVV